jgi:4-hydroxy-3-polyprenylbenzoate decarboxylase
MIVISLRQRYPGRAKQALMSAIGDRQKSSVYCYHVAVDDDVDPSNLEEVIWPCAPGRTRLKTPRSFEACGRAA